MPVVILGTAALTSLSYILSHMTFLFPEWAIREHIIGIVMTLERDFRNVTCVWVCNVHAL